MTREPKAPPSRNVLPESLAAELAAAAYCVALRTQSEGTWLDLELNLWRALAERVHRSIQNYPPVPACSPANELL